MKRNLTLHYCLHQFAYWAASAGILTFATTFLLEKGFPASQVGILMASASILSGITQPALAARVDRGGTGMLFPMMAVLTTVSTMTFGLLLVEGLSPMLFALLYLVGVWSFDAMVPLLNAIIVYYGERGRAINYGLGRGVGSFAYSLAALGLGYVIRMLGPDWMIRIILLLLPPCILAALFYPRMTEEKREAADAGGSAATEPCSLATFFGRYRWYCLSLGGVLLLAMFHAMTENYMIAIMGRLNGDSRHVGIALFIATLIEAPVLFFFNRVRSWISDNWLIRLAAFSFLLKSVLFLVAPSVPFLYATQMLQATSYAFLSPVQVYYANAKVAPNDMVKGQAFITASYTLGCAMGNLAGGQLLEWFGVSAILIAGVVIAALGTLVLLLTVERRDAWPTRRRVE